MTKSPLEKPNYKLAPADAVVVGIVAGASGIRGEIKVKTMTDFPNRFAVGNLLYLDGAPMRLEGAKWNRHGVVLKLDLVNDRTHAQNLYKAPLMISATELEPLPKGSYYHFEIIGIEVWSEDVEYLGIVKEIITTGSNDVYVIDSLKGKDILIPARGNIVLDVDILKNRMVVQLPQGLR